MKLNKKIHKDIQQLIHKNHKQYKPFLLIDDRRVRIEEIFVEGAIVTLYYIVLKKGGVIEPIVCEYNTKKRAPRNILKEVLIEAFRGFTRDLMYYQNTEEEIQNIWHERRKVRSGTLTIKKFDFIIQ